MSFIIKSIQYRIAISAIIGLSSTLKMVGHPVKIDQSELNNTIKFKNHNELDHKTSANFKHKVGNNLENKHRSNTDVEVDPWEEMKKDAIENMRIFLKECKNNDKILENFTDEELDKFVDNDKLDSDLKKKIEDHNKKVIEKMPDTANCSSNPQCFSLASGKSSKWKNIGGFDEETSMILFGNYSPFVFKYKGEIFIGVVGCLHCSNGRIYTILKNGEDIPILRFWIEKNCCKRVNKFENNIKKVVEKHGNNLARFDENIENVIILG